MEEDIFKKVGIERVVESTQRENRAGPGEQKCKGVGCRVQEKND